MRALVAAQRRAERTRLRLAAAAGAATALAATALLGLSGWFISAAALAGVAGAAAVYAFNYLIPSAVIRLLAIVRTAARYGERTAGHEAALRALARLRPQLFDALASAPPEHALALSSGEASARLVQDVDAVQTLFVRLSAPWMLAAGVVSAVALTALATPLAAGLLALAMGAGVFGAVVLARRLADPAGRERQVAMGAFKDRLSAFEAAAPELKAYGLERRAMAEAATVADRHDRAQVAAALAGGWLSAWQAGGTALAVLLVVPAAWGAGAPMAALAALSAVMGMEAAAGLVSALHQNGAAAEAEARLEAAMPPAPEGLDRAAPSPRLTLSALAEGLEPPRRLAVVGASGAGKTTLVERLVGLRQAVAGEAAVGAADIASVDPAARRTLFAYAAQEVRLIDGSVRENLRLAGDFDDETLWRALEDAALAERIRADPLGLAALVGPNGERLSGGERRRLVLARAYLRAAPWLVLDEPTEGLDAATEKRVLEGLERRLAASGQGLIVVSHRPAPTRLCDLVIRVEGRADDGRLRLSQRSSGRPDRAGRDSSSPRSAAAKRTHDG